MEGKKPVHVKFFSTEQRQDLLKQAMDLLDAAKLVVAQMAEMKNVMSSGPMDCGPGMNKPIIEVIINTMMSPLGLFAAGHAPQAVVELEFLKIYQRYRLHGDMTEFFSRQDTFVMQNGIMASAGIPINVMEPLIREVVGSERVLTENPVFKAFKALQQGQQREGTQDGI